jgi:hypothetical protein
MILSTSSSTLSASGAVVTRPCIFHGMILNGAGAAATATLNDNKAAASGIVIEKVQAAAATTFSSRQGSPVECSNGLYLTLSGAGAEAIVYYSLL